MGVRRFKSAVADAGPLIHLAEIGCVQLARVFRTVHIPESVWQETEKHVPAFAESVGALNVERHQVGRQELQSFVAEHGLGTLHHGECEALHLCRTLGIPLVLTDDMAVRKAARRMEIVAVGSLGVIARAVDLGLLPLIEGEKHVADLYDVSSLFVTRTIVDLVIEDLRRRASRR